MRKRLVAVAVAAIALSTMATFTASPAGAREAPVRAGKDSCGNFNVWINGDPLFYYVWCGPSPY